MAKKAKVTTVPLTKADGLPKGNTVELGTVYSMQSKKGTVGFGGKVLDADGRRYQVQAWLIGSAPVS